MALFKIFEGTLNELNQVPEKEGYAYFLTDEQLLVIDTSEGRKFVNALNAGETESAINAHHLVDIDGKTYTVSQIFALAGQVKSVNGYTGEVTLKASDVGAATSEDINVAINKLNSSVAATPGKYISSITQTGGTITATKVDVPTIDASETNSAGTVKPGSNKTVDFTAITNVQASDHTVTSNKATYTLDLSDFAKTSELPSIPSGTGGATAANDAKVIGGVVLNGHTLSAAQKTISAGNGISVSGGTSSITIAHADTSSASSLTEKTRTYVTGVTLDTYGHITGLTTGTETVEAPSLDGYATEDYVANAIETAFASIARAEEVAW